MYESLRKTALAQMSYIGVLKSVVRCSSKSRRTSTDVYEKDEKLNEKEKQLLEKDAQVGEAAFRL